MTLLDSLRAAYGTNEPILSGEITFGDYSRPWIYKQLKALCEEGKLIRYEKGVYYIPTETIFGKSLLDPRKVIERKYIRSSSQVMGFYSGLTMQYQLRLTTQMPNVIELYTNNETTRVRDVMIGKQRVILRRARTPITSENAGILSFLEMMTDLDPKTLDEEKKRILADYLQSNAITRRDITTYSPAFPDRTMRNLIESEIIYCIVQ